MMGCVAEGLGTRLAPLWPGRRWWGITLIVAQSKMTTAFKACFYGIPVTQTRTCRSMNVCSQIVVVHFLVIHLQIVRYRTQLSIPLLAPSTRAVIISTLYPSRKLAHGKWILGTKRSTRASQIHNQVRLGFDLEQVNHLQFYTYSPGDLPLRRRQAGQAKKWGSQYFHVV